MEPRQAAPPAPRRVVIPWHSLAIALALGLAAALVTRREEAPLRASVPPAAQDVRVQGTPTEAAASESFLPEPIRLDAPEQR